MKHIKKFNERFFERTIKKVSHTAQRIVLPTFTSKECEYLGYKIGFELEKDRYAFSR